MIKPLSITITASILLFAITAIAQTPKVVVIPLNSSQRTTCTAPDEVLSLGKCWKDRNLGATQVATSSTDSAAYGDLYQWGRTRDGHQHRWSNVVQFASAFSDDPGSDFFGNNATTFDWRYPQNHILWQGLGAINNPCPQGFRLPTDAEFENERLSWSSNDYVGAFDSPLKLVMAGYRHNFTGSLQFVDNQGRYWTSTVSGPYSRNLTFLSGNAAMGNTYRTYGLSVRCIKD